MGNNIDNKFSEVSPLLTKLVRGYKNNELIGHHILPSIEVGLKFRYPEMSKELFRAVLASRGSGGSVPKVDLQKITWNDDSCLEYPLGVGIDRREIEAAEGVAVANLKRRKSLVAMANLQLGKEVRQAELVTDASAYSADNKEELLTSSKWSHADSDPITDIVDASQVIMDKVFIKPNVLVLGNQVFKALKFHPLILDKIKYSQTGIVTEDLLKVFFDVDKVIVGKAHYAPADLDTLVPIWDNIAWLGYVNPNPRPSEEDPSFGYTFEQKGYPQVKEVTDADGNVMYTNVHLSDKPKVLNYDAGFLFTSVVATS